ncbi:GL18103 [Drosophila persimilis]|uniref:GL18103 n=1 Tax=Drosophila persimilis TaxID=7234 RepID=B4HC19_DROPE|nr:GL18103 [Drosophila persimilis]
MAQNKPNAFMAFVADWRAFNRFGRGLSTSEAVAKCGPIWEGMSDRERGPYKSKAKDSNVLERESKTERLNCLGVTISKMQVEKNEAIDADLQMKRNIKRIVLKATNSMKLEEEEFLFVSFNYFTKALNGDVYQPAELSGLPLLSEGGYHEKVDRTKYCTKSMVLRWGYMISLYICGDLAIPLQPRKHVPIEVKHSYTVTPGDSSLALDGTSTDSGYSGY